MASQDVEPCLVCGIVTKNRCGNCQAAGVSLFFCGKEHQKLVWKAHKPHCGPGKADPFFIEPLSDDDIVDLRQRAQLPLMRGYPSIGLSNLEHDLVAAAGMPFEYIVEHLTGPVDERDVLPLKPYLVGLVRTSRFANWTTASAARMTPDTLRTSFVHTVMSCLLSEGLLPLHPHSAPWFTPLNHKLLVIASLTFEFYGELMGHAPAPPGGVSIDKLMLIAELLPVAREKVTKWVHDGLGTGDSRYRRALARVTFQLDNGL